MEKAVLTAYKPPIGKLEKPGKKDELDRLTFRYNPTHLTLVKETQWARHSARLAPHASVPEFLGSQPKVLTMPVVLEEPANRRAKEEGPTNSAVVDQEIKTLLAWCEPNRAALDANESSPPWLELGWGEVSSVTFWMVLKKVSVQYTRFSEDGRVLRAQCELVMEEVGV
ncbi:hypothetical protein ACFWAR_14815 [Streptomyces sp. NPDC059917]|uniref:CIS tube protein n=1 Tax=Streptomyces sp. NPDC059917 TaxID=3347002 RepID=UPI00366571DC